MKRKHLFIASRLRATQGGLTLVELLVAMTLGLVITIVALSMLILGRTGYNAVDSSTQLIDKERFAVDTLSRVIVQAGFQDFGAGTLTTRGIAKSLGDDPEPDLFGWNNAIYTQLADLDITGSTKIVDENRPGKCTVNDTSCKNGSDVLLVRFQGVGATGSPDGTMVNCRGESEPGLATGDLDERSTSIFYVNRDTNTGEPSLYCGYYNHASGAWVSGQPLIEGVESLQVLFGTDNVTPGTVPAATGQDTIADRWLRADQIKVAGNAAATRENWRRVRAVRVGMVLRGPVGSAQEQVTATFAPLGANFVATADKGSQLDVAADSRLRRVVNFTAHIRNDLSVR